MCVLYVYLINILEKDSYLQPINKLTGFLGLKLFNKLTVTEINNIYGTLEFLARKFILSIWCINYLHLLSKMNHKNWIVFEIGSIKYQSVLLLATLQIYLAL